MKANFGDFMRFLNFLDETKDLIESHEYHAVEQVGLAYEGDVKKVSPIDQGTYRSSIRSEMRNGLRGPEAHVGSPMPYAARLEWGYFDKTDRLGRHYYQNAQPHWRPTFDLNLAKYEAIMQFELLKDVKMK